MRAVGEAARASAAMVAAWCHRRAQRVAVCEALARPRGRGVDVDVLVVPDIPLEPSGKLRPSRSLVASEYDGIEWASPSSASS